MQVEYEHRERLHGVVKILEDCGDGSAKQKAAKVDAVSNEWVMLDTNRKRVCLYRSECQRRRARGLANAADDFEWSEP